MNLKPFTLLVTGAGKGIGAAVIRECLRQADAFSLQGKSLQLALTSRTEADLRKLTDEALAKKVPCISLAKDLTDCPEEFASWVTKNFQGSLDCLVHSAGVGRFKSFLNLTTDDLDFTLNTNVRASFLLTQEVYRHFKSKKSGQVIWITSVASEVPFEQSAAYCMSKYAQRGLIDVLRLTARKDGIRITEVRPGAVVTPMWGDIPDTMKDKMMGVEEVAQAIVQAILMPERTSIEVLTLRPIGGDLA